MKRDVQPIADAIVGFRSSVLLFTAVHLGIFKFISKRHLGAGTISTGLGLDRRASEIVLDALVAIGFLQKKGLRYSNAPVSLAYLDPSSATSLAKNLNYQYRLMDAWMELPRVLSTGKPRQDLVRRLMDDRFVDEYIGGMRELARGSAPQVATHLARFKGDSVLDVGGGHGFYLQSLLEKRPDVVGTLLDLPKTIRLARPFFKGLSRRVQFRPADYRRSTWGLQKYDLVLMSHVTHDESEKTNLGLFNKAHRALRPGGCLAIHDFFVNEAHTGSRFAALFSVHMLTYTSQGRVYSLSDYTKLLLKAGFVVVKSTPINGGCANESRLLVAQKKRS